MKCIFCKCDASSSRSIEHIIPQSLGNIDHVLPRGIVCDTCNSYFARKVEGPLLETPWFKNLRSRQWVANKRGLVPPMQGTVPGARLLANVWLDGPKLTIGGRNEREEKILTDAILSGRASRVILPLIAEIDEQLMSRFLAKVAIEVLAQRTMIVDGWREEIVENVQLDKLRTYARIGSKSFHWPFLRRRLYGENDIHSDGHAPYQVWHEYDLLYTEQQELYLILCIFGEEFALNLGGPDISNYMVWLAEHNGTSPLYMKDKMPDSNIFY